MPSASGVDRFAQTRCDDDVETSERRALDESLGDRREDRDHREAQREPDEEMDRQILALRVASRNEPPGEWMPRPQLAHANGGRLALVPLVERGDDRLAISVEPAPEEHEAGDERDEDREQQAHAADVVNQSRQVPAERRTRGC